MFVKPSNSLTWEQDSLPGTHPPLPRDRNPAGPASPLFFLQFESRSISGPSYRRRTIPVALYRHRKESIANDAGFRERVPELEVRAGLTLK